MSKKVDDVLEAVIAHAYDPQKAHEYYLRTRKLKGRRRASDQLSGPREGFNPGGSATAPPRRSARQTPKQRQALARARVAAIQKRLDRLKEVLAELVEQAKRRSGIEVDDKSEKSTAETKDAKPKRRTAAEKKKDAKAQAERREKEQRLSPDQKVAAIQKEMAQVREQIAEIRAKLARPARPAQQPTSNQDSGKDQTPGTKPQTALEGRRPLKKEGERQNGRSR
jgi:hypothetical protein